MASENESEVLSRISGETLEKARRELREDPETRAALVEELRTRIEAAKDNSEYEGVELVQLPLSM